MIWLGAINETFRTANSIFRTFLFGAVVLGLGFAGWQGYSFYNTSHLRLAEKERELDATREQLASLSHKLEHLNLQLQETSLKLETAETSLRLLKLSHRVARIRVLDQSPMEDSNRLMTTIEFFEVNEDGAPLNTQRRKFEIEGDRVYIECLVAKFEDHYIEQTALDRSTAICLFQRIFGEYQQPQDGFAIDEVGASPTAYGRGGQITAFEQSIWDDFWNLANDPERAAELGIRAAHADAPSIVMRPGKTYELELRSTGEFTLRALPEDSSPAGEEPA